MFKVSANFPSIGSLGSLPPPLDCHLVSFLLALLTPSHSWPTCKAHLLCPTRPRVYTFRLCGRAQRGVAPRADLLTAAGYGPPSNGSHSHPLGALVATAWRVGSLSHSSHTSHPSHPHGELPPSPGTGLGIQRGAACGPAQEEGLWAPETADGLGPTLSSPHLCLSSLPKQVPALELFRGRERRR